MKMAIAHGAVIASFNVESFGIERLARLRKADINRRYAQYRKMISLE
jgi:hypothetical protein